MIHKELSTIWGHTESDQDEMYRWLYFICSAGHIGKMTYSELLVAYDKVQELKKYPHKLHIFRMHEELQSFIRSQLQDLKFYIYAQKRQGQGVKKRTQNKKTPRGGWDDLHKGRGQFGAIRFGLLEHARDEVDTSEDEQQCVAS